MVDVETCTKKKGKKKKEEEYHLSKLLFKACRCGDTHRYRFVGIRDEYVCS